MRPLAAAFLIAACIVTLLPVVAPMLVLLRHEKGR
jgi:hypothetical protein